MLKDILKNTLEKAQKEERINISFNDDEVKITSKKDKKHETKRKETVRK